jgi:CheY-like chemotaxis protein
MFTLLCIDDEPSINMLHKMIFEAHGHRVILATDGIEGLLFMQSERVDLVIVDYRMPGMTGAAVAAAIRSSHADLPIVMLSGYIDLANDVLPRCGSVPGQRTGTTRCHAESGAIAFGSSVEICQKKSLIALQRLRRSQARRETTST